MSSPAGARSGKRDPAYGQEVQPPDLIEMGGHRPRWWPFGDARGPAISIAFAALVAGLLLGFIGGHLQAGTRGRPARAATTHATVRPVGDFVVSATGSRCAVQRGRTLQLGIEIMNRSDRTVVLRQIKSVLPLGGLREIATQWGTCGSLPLPGPGLGRSNSLAPGATGWLTVTFDVLIGCPQALPVYFRVSFVQASRLVTADLDSFPDLSQVQYSNCNSSRTGTVKIFVSQH